MGEQLAGAAGIERDLGCVQCGYNLRGLQEEGRCPECGTGIGVSLGGFAGAEVGWVKHLHTGVLLYLVVMVWGAVMAGLVVGRAALPWAWYWLPMGLWGLARDFLGLMDWVRPLVQWGLFVWATWQMTWPRPAGEGPVLAGSSAARARRLVVVGLVFRMLMRVAATVLSVRFSEIWLALWFGWVWHGILLLEYGVNAVWMWFLFGWLGEVAEQAGLRRSARWWRRLRWWSSVPMICHAMQQTVNLISVTNDYHPGPTFQKVDMVLRGVEGLLGIGVFVWVAATMLGMAKMCRRVDMTGGWTLMKASGVEAWGWVRAGVRWVGAAARYSGER